MSNEIFKESLGQVYNYIQKNEEIMPEYGYLKNELKKLLKTEEFPFKVEKAKKHLSKKDVEILGTTIYVKDNKKDEEDEEEKIDYVYLVTTEIISKLLSPNKSALTMGISSSLAVNSVMNGGDTDPYEKEKEFFILLGVEKAFEYINDSYLHALSDHYCNGNIKEEEITNYIGKEKTYAA